MLTISNDRILFDVSWPVKEIYILKIRNRQDVYKISMK